MSIEVIIEFKFLLNFNIFILEKYFLFFSKLNFVDFKGKFLLSDEYESYSLDLNDTDVNSFSGQLYVLSQSEFPDYKIIRMRKFSSIKHVVSLSKHGLQTFECFKDAFKNSICDQ